MQIVFKLYASLGKYLPPGGPDKHAREIEVPEDATPSWVIEKFGVPAEMAQLVLVNGHYVAPEERATVQLGENDELVIFPPVAGG